jgi:hypothetical protein
MGCFLRRGPYLFFGKFYDKNFIYGWTDNIMQSVSWHGPLSRYLPHRSPIYSYFLDNKLCSMNISNIARPWTF